MSYFEARPAASLHAWVERVCFSSDAGRPFQPVRVVPDGACDVLFSVARGGACTAQLFGLKTRTLWVTDPEPRENVLLRLRPGAVSQVFGLPADAVTDCEVPLAEL